MAKESIYSAFRVNQPGLKDGQCIYCATIPVKDLIDTTMFKVDFWSKELLDSKDQGYQRLVNSLHASRIASFLGEERAILPTAVLLSTRNSLPDFKDDKILFNKFPVYIVDGQHRIAGLRAAIEDNNFEKWKEATLPVIILAGFSKYEEMVQFVDLNTKQKRIVTDLALQLMAEMATSDPSLREKFVQEGTDWKTRAIKIVNNLNNDKKSPWHDSIKIAGDNAKGSYRASSNSFATSLKPLVGNNGAFDSNRDIEKNLEVISNYWWALRDIFPDAFLEPKEYAIQKTAGLFTLHTLLQAILGKKGYDFGFKRNDLKRLLEKVFSETEVYNEGGVDTDFWRSDNRSGVTMYGSMKGFKLLSDNFKEALNSVD